MALILIHTAGDASANTYVSLADAESYFESRLHKDAWDNAETADKNAALVWATRLLDSQMDWVGNVVTTTQALRWPRSGVVTEEGLNVDSSTIPQFLKNAVCEMALLLLSTDRTAENPMDKMSKIRVGPVEIGLRWTSPSQQVIADQVYEYLKHYAEFYSSGGGMAKLVRV